MAADQVGAPPAGFELDIEAPPPGFVLDPVAPPVPDPTVAPEQPKAKKLEQHYETQRPPPEPPPVAKDFSGKAPVKEPGEDFLQWVENVWGVSASSLKAGYGASVTGLMQNGTMPEILPENAPMFARILYQIGLLGGDAPWMIPGAVLGGAAGGAAGTAAPIVGNTAGAVVGAGAGSFMLPEAMRTILMEQYGKGEVEGFADFFDRAVAVMIQTGKAGIIGGATGGVMGPAGKLVPAAAGPVLKNTAEVGAAVVTMTTVAAGLEGQVPRARDFVDAAVLVGGLKGSTVVASKLRTIYAKTGKHPHQVIEDMKADPTIAQELLSSNVELPSKYAKPEPDLALPELEVVGKKMTAVEEAAFDKANPPEPVLPKELPRPKDVPEPDIAQQAILDRIVEAPERKSFTWDQAYTNAINDLHPIFMATEAMGGKNLPAGENPGKLAQLTRGAFGKADQFLEFGTYDFKTLANTGPGLKAVLEPVKNDLDGFRAYAVSKRAAELDARGIESGMPMDGVHAVIKAGDAKYGKAFADLLDYQNALTKHLLDSGVIGKETYALMQEANKSYVPFYRLLDDVASPGGPGTGLKVRNPIKAIKGSERKVLDPIESIIKNTYLYIALAERNAVGRAFIDLVEKAPNGGDFAVKVKRPVRPIEVSKEEVGRLLEQHGVDPKDAEAFQIFRPGVLVPKENEIVVFRQGKAETWEVHPDVAAAFKATDRETAPWLFKILQIPASSLRAGAVLTPDFMLRNAVRDQLSAYTFSENGYIPVLDMMRGMGALVAKGETYQNWLKSGGANSTMVAVDRRYIQENVFKLDKDTGIASRAWNVAKSPLEFARIGSEIIENSTRLGEFKRAVGKGMEFRDAGFASREVTLDFARIGAKMRGMNMITAFFNANVQGTDRTIRAFKENPLATTAKVAASITLPSVLLWFANKDDPRYKEIPQWQKDLFWIVMTDKHIYRIPKPFELGLMFGSVPERTLEAFYAENPDAFNDLTKTMVEAFTPGVVPTGALPVAEQVTGYSFFKGGPVVPARMEGFLPEYQYEEYQTELSKSLGRIVGSFPGLKDKSIASPLVIDNYIRGWTGGTGMYAMQIADAALRKTGVLPDPVKPASTLADLPVIKAFVVRHPSGQAQSIQSFYERYNSAKKTLDTVQMLAKQGDYANVIREMEIGHDSLIRLEGIRQVLSQQNQMIRLIYKNPDIRPEEKRQLIDSIYGQMIELTAAGNSILQHIEKITTP